MVKLFSGTANPGLAEKVAKLLNIPLSQAEVVRFANSEVRVRIKDRVKNSTAIVIQPTSNPTDSHLIELFFFCDALKRQEASKVIGIIPYFGYARQNRQHRIGEGVSANVVIRFFETIGFNKIYTIDLHDEATEGVFSIAFKNLSALSILSRKIKQYIKKNLPSTKVAIVSPDQGGIERARNFGHYFFGHPDFSLTVIEKARNLDKIHQSKAVAIYGNVKDKIVIIVDDIVTSARTLINAAQLCLRYGGKTIIAAVVHHDFSPEAAKIIEQSPIDRFFTTDTIQLKKEQKIPKLEEVSVAPLIAKELKSLYP